MATSFPLRGGVRLPERATIQELFPNAPPAFCALFDRTVQVPAQSAPKAFVYFFERPDGLIKIGFSKDPVRRCRGIENQSGFRGRLLAVEASVDAARESALHDLFESSRGIGEWFTATAPLLEVIDAAREKHGDPATVVLASRHRSLRASKPARIGGAS